MEGWLKKGFWAGAALPAALLLCASAPAGAANILVRSESSIGRTLSNYPLIDEQGAAFPLYRFRGKALLLNFFYADCPDACPMISHSIQSALASLPPELKKSAAALSVTLTPDADTPPRRLQYARGFAVPGVEWRFAAASPGVLERLVRDTGFEYTPGRAPAHMNRLTLVSPSGAVIGHFYGESFDKGELAAAIRAAVEGRPLGARLSVMFDRLVLYCSAYDADRDSFRPDYRFIAVAVVQSLLALGTGLYFLAAFVRRPR